MKKIAVTFSFLMISFLNFAQEIQYRIQDFGSNVYVFTAYEMNIIISIDEKGEVLLVDAMVEELGETIKNVIDSLGGKHIKYIINTHYHYDHTFGNKALADNSIIIGDSYLNEVLSTNQELLGQTQKALPEFARPNITFTGLLNVNFNNDTVKLSSLFIGKTGGHTGGDIVAYFPENKLLHVGDLIFSDMFPFIDAAHGGNIDMLIQSIKYIYENYPEDTNIITGHGRILQMTDLPEYIQMLEYSFKTIKKHWKKGKTIEEIISLNLFADYQSYSKAFSTEQWIEFVYNSLEMSNKK